MSESRNSDTVKERRVSYIKRYLSIRAQGIPTIFIDESPWGVRVPNRPGSKKGAPCLVEPRTERIKNLVAMAAVSNIEGVEQVDVVRGTVDAAVFQNSTFKLLSKSTEPTALVVDSVGPHHGEWGRGHQRHGHRVLCPKWQAVSRAR